jgi:hypothetical protein
MRPQSLSPPFRRSKVVACTAIGTLTAANGEAAALLAQQRDRASGRVEPNTEPPESSTASMLATVISGSSRRCRGCPVRRRG